MITHLRVIIYSTLFGFTLLLSFMNLLAPRGVLMILWAACCVGSFFLASYQKRQKMFDRNLIKYILIFTVPIIIAGFAHNRVMTHINDIIMVVCSILLAYIIAEKKIFTLPIKVVFYLISFYIIFRIVRGGISATEFFLNSSANVISVVVIYIAITVNLLEYINERRISILPSILALYASMIGMGRSGVISALIYVCVILFFSFNKMKSGLKILLIGAFLIFIVAGFNITGDYSDMQFYEKLQRKGLELDGRDIYWQEYVKNIDFLNFLFGYDYNDNFVFFTKNPHNSWIKLHYHIGIMAFVVILLTFRAGYVYARKNLLILTFLFVIILRSISDTVMFFLYWDYLLFSFILLSYNTDRIDKEHNVSLRLI